MGRFGTRESHRNGAAHSSGVAPEVWLGDPGLERGEGLLMHSFPVFAARECWVGKEGPSPSPLPRGAGEGPEGHAGAWELWP